MKADGSDGDGDALPGLVRGVSTFLPRCDESDSAAAVAADTRRHWK